MVAYVQNYHSSSEHRAERLSGAMLIDRHHRQLLRGVHTEVPYSTGSPPQVGKHSVNDLLQN